jgi:excisionase family DNA binding protein
MSGRFLTIEQVADELGVSDRTAYRLVHQMNPLRVGTLLRVSRTAMENWIHKNTESSCHQESSDDGSGTRRPAAAAGPRRGPRGSRTRRGGDRLVSTGCTDKKAAEARAGILEREAVDPAYAAANATTVERVLNDYALSRKRLGRSAGTLHHVTVKAGHPLRVLRDVLGVVCASDVKHPTMVRYVDQRLVEGARTTTIKKELRVFGAAWKLALRNQLVRTPVGEIMPELEDDYEPGTRALTPLEIVGLAIVLPLARMAVVAFAVATGCDPGAIPRARREDVADDYALCRVRGTKRKGRDRIVPLPLPEQRCLLEWAVRHAEGGLGGRLFPAWTNLRRDLAGACKKLGILHCSPNDLRRTYSSWLRAAGIEPQLIAAAMGHSDSRMVERVYGRLTIDALARLLSERVTRVGIAVSEAPKVPVSDAMSDESSAASGDAGTVRYMSGESGQTGASEGIADKTASVASPREASPIVVRRGGIEPPTRGFSVPYVLRI